MKPSDMPQVLADRGGAQTLCDWGGGLIWARVPEAGDAMAATLRGLLATLGGHATLLRATDALLADVPAFHPEPPGLAALSAGLRAKFDPRGILNAGVMG
jgi:glycolate oxidase FAD binding subunit